MMISNKATQYDAAGKVINALMNSRKPAVLGLEHEFTTNWQSEYNDYGQNLL